MSDAGEVPPTRKVPFWVKLLLAVSLALNLLVIGLAAGAAWRFSKGPARDTARGGFAFVSALEREDRRAMFTELRDVRRDVAQQGRQDIVQVLDLLRAEELDREQLEAKVSAFNARARDMRGAIQDRLIEQITGMSLQERLAYADRLERHMKKGGRTKHARD